jgi:hypothetical protein
MFLTVKKVIHFFKFVKLLIAVICAFLIVENVRELFLVIFFKANELAFFLIIHNYFEFSKLFAQYFL